MTKIGRKRIVNLSPPDDTEEARACSEIYADVRDSVFREHPWNSLIDRQILNESLPVPPFGYSHRYALPPACLRVLTLNDISTVSWFAGELVDDFTRIKWKVEGRNLLTDEGEAKIVFVQRLLDPNQYDALLLEALASRIAAELAWPLTKNSRLTQLMWEIYNSKKSTARSTDGMEGTVELYHIDEIGGVRR